MHVKNLLVLLWCFIGNRIEILKYAWVFFWSPNDGTNIVIDVTGWEMIESITWYLKNTKETLPKFQENIYIKKKLVTMNIYNLFLSLQIETVTVGIRALAWVQEWKKK